MIWALAKARPLLVGGFVLALLATLFFAGRLAYQAIYWADPARREQAIEGWMTVGYIAKSWDVDAPDLDALASFPRPSVKGHPQPLSEIARDRGVAVAVVIAEAEAAVQTLVAQKEATKARRDKDEKGENRDKDGEKGKTP